MPNKLIAPPVPGEPEGAARLTWRNPIAKPAARLCEPHKTEVTLVGKVACQACWDRAILIDREFALAHGLPLHIEVDLSYVDEVAVRKAMQARREGKKDSETVELTRLERRIVRSRLARERARRNLLRSFTCAQAGGMR
jgi:hypothetical protein